MEKAKKKLVSSVILVAIVAAVVFFALVFGQTNTDKTAFEEPVAVTGVQADGVTTGIYNQMSKDEAIAYYNDLVNNQGYTGIDGQTAFNNVFGSGKGVGEVKYALRPYDDYGNAIEYVAQSAAYMNRTTLDGCGAKLKITSLPGITELSNPQQTINLPNGDKGYGSGTFFELNKRRSSDEGVYIKVSGGLAGYALGVSLSNLNVEFTASYSTKVDDDAASYCYGGLFGVLSVGDVNNVSGSPSVIKNCRIYNNGSVNLWKGVSGSLWHADDNSRPYHALTTFGTIAGYCYNSQFINSTVELGSNMNLVAYSEGNQDGAYKNGTPRAIIGGAFGILQNDCVVSDIFVTGAGTIDCTVDDKYYMTSGSAKMGIGGALVGCVVDGSSNQIEFMVNGSGATYIKNIVSNWKGTVRAKGEVASGDNNVLYSYDSTQTGVIVGINGSYYPGSTGATNMSGIYFIYSEDNAPSYLSNFFASVSGGGLTYTDFKYSYIQIKEDGTDWLNLSDADRKTDIEFSEDGSELVLTYDVSDNSAEREILWEYSLTTIGSSTSTTRYSTWMNKTADGANVPVTSYEDAVKTQTVTFANVSEKTRTSNTKVEFTSGQAVYYKVSGQDGWTFEDVKAGNAAIRTYQVENRQYNAQVINAPSVEFSLTPDFSSGVIASSQDNAQWGAQKDGGGSFTDVGSDATKNVNNWYLSLRSDVSNDTYAYYDNVNGKNYVAYKADNAAVSSASGAEGLSIANRYYVYIVTPKIITPVVTTESDLVYSATAKTYNVNFGNEICNGDSVTATISVFTLVNGVESPKADGAIDAGTYRVRITGLSDTNYRLSENVADVDFEITKRPLTADIGDESGFVYDKTAKSPTINITGGIEGVDQASIISVTYRKDGEMSANIDAGNYEISIALTSEGEKNYTISGETSGTFTISPASLTYNGLEVYEFIYDSYSVGVQKLAEKGITFVNEALGYSCDFTVSFREAGGTAVASSVTYVGNYECIIEPNNESNYAYEGDTKVINVNIVKAPVTFGLTPNYDESFDGDNTVVYTGNDMSFTASTAGLGNLDKSSYKFAVRIYPAVYDEQTSSWIKEEGAEGASTVRNAGKYIAVLEQTTSANLDADPNYDTVSNPGTRELVFEIKKATMTWTFTGEGLVYDDASGIYSTGYNGEYYKLTLESGDLNSQLAAGDQGLYLLTGNVEYFAQSSDGAYYSVGIDGVRNAGNYLVVPEVERGNNPDLTVNYEIRGGSLVISPRVLDIDVYDVVYPYGTDVTMLTEEDYGKMWGYSTDESAGTERIIEADGQIFGITFPDFSSGEGVVGILPTDAGRGSYDYMLCANLANENYYNYEIRYHYVNGTAGVWRVSGYALDLEITVTDEDGTEAAKVPVSGSVIGTADAIYYGGAYTVGLNAVNADEKFPAVSFTSAGGDNIVNYADGGYTVTFTLNADAAKAYYIGAAEGAGDTTFTVTFNVNKRTVEVTPVDADVEYGKEFVSAGVTFDGDGFVGDDADKFTYSYAVDLGKDVGSTATIGVTVNGDATNYNFVSGTGTATRVARVLHVTFTDREKVYGDAALAISGGDYTLGDGESVVEGDDLGLKYVLTKDGGTFEDAVNLTTGEYALGATAQNSNYEIVVTEGSKFNVYQKAVNVELASVKAAYDTYAHPITVVSIDGLIEGDEGVTAVVQYLSDGEPIDGDPVNIGTYTATVTGFSSPDYTVGEVSGENTVEITKVAVNVTVNDAVMAYGTDKMLPADGAFFTSDNEQFNGDELDPYYIYNDGESDVTKLALGEYPETLTLGFAGEAADNYQINVVNKAKLTVEAADLAEVAYLEEDSSTYDGNGKTVTVMGVQAAQVSVVITRNGAAVQDGVVDAGEYTVTVTPLGTNYVGEAVLTYTVEKAQLDATLTSTSSVYDGNPVELKVSAKYGDVIFTVTKDGNPADAIVGAGTYNVTITAAENSNYTGSVEGQTYTVEKAQIETPAGRDSFVVTVVWNGFTIVDKSGNYDVLVTLTDGNWDGATDSVTDLKPETEYTVYVKFAGDENHIESGVISMTVETGKKLAATLDPEDVTYTVYYNKIVVTVEGDSEFAYSSDGGRTWQDGNTLSGLKAGTEYTVSVKVKESASQGESNVVTFKVTTGADPAAFNDAFDLLGDTVTAADLDNYDKMMEAYASLADGDKANVDATKLQNLQDSYNALINEVNSDVIAAQNVARKAAGKGAVAAAASILAAVAAAIVAKKKFVF